MERKNEREMIYVEDVEDALSEDMIREQASAVLDSYSMALFVASVEKEMCATFFCFFVSRTQGAVALRRRSAFYTARNLCWTEN